MSITRPAAAALKALLALTLILGVAYPLAITAVGLLVPGPAGGSVISVGGREVGSSLLGQQTTDPRWFQARPSASEYSGDTSGGSNYGPNAPELAKEVAARAAALTEANPQAVGPVPADALAASGSGLDPHISPAYAAWQAPRVATANGIPLAEVRRLVAGHTQGPALGFIGTERVNVTELNVALAARTDQ